MSLQIWLPLNGNLKNRGCNPSLTIASVQTGCSVSTDGKLGSCYKNTGTNNAVAIPISFSSNQFSMCAWLRIDTLRNNWARSFGMTGTGTYVGFGCESSNGSAVGFHFYKTIDGTNTNIFDQYPVSSEVGKWVHYCMVYDGSNYFIYKNGSQVSTGSVHVANTPVEMNTLLLFGGYPNYYSYHSLNDVRIYDHALSVVEVKEIAKGLVCHYTLSNYGMPNLLKYTKANSSNQTLLKNNVTSGWNNLTLTTIDGHMCYKYPSAQSSTWFSSGSWFSPMEANTTYTYTAWIYFTANANFNFTSLGHFQVYNSDSTASDKAHEDISSARIYEPSSIKANTWTKVRITFTTNSLSGSFFQVYPRYNIAANTGDLYFRDCKLEKNDNETQWLPNSIDNEYKALGYDSTTVIDCSGYGYNGTKSGTLTPSTDTPRYALSTNFPENSSTVTITSYLTNGQTLTEISVSCWYKTNTMNSTAPNLWSLGENTFLRLRLASTTSIWYYARVGSTQTAYTYDAGKTLTDNVWHHVVLTFKNGVFVVYVDGSQIGTSDASGTATYLTCANTAWHLAGYTANSENFIGNLSDFRIYVTCLSANDVKRLYNTAASASKNGAMLGYEFKEVI